MIRFLLILNNPDISVQCQSAKAQGSENLDVLAKAFVESLLSNAFAIKLKMKPYK